MRGVVTLTAVVLVCGGGLLIWQLNRPKEPEQSQGGPVGPDLVLITIDTLRADRLELYGHGRETSPALTALGQAGMTFENAVSQAPWTLPAMASIHTGLYPSQHGVMQANRQLGPHAVTLAELLSQHGYETAAVISHTFTSRRYGFDQGFDRFDEQWIATEQDVSSEHLTRTALSSYDVSGNASRFLWVHYFDPHYSYLRHPEYGFADGYQGDLGDEVSHQKLGGSDELEAEKLSEQDKRYVLDVYDEEIRHTDHWIGRLIEGIRRIAGERPVVFLVTADHGEYFLERGRYGHGKDVYRELVHVPLILAGDHPGITTGERLSDPVETASIPATLMELAGIAEHPFRGRSLLQVSRAGPSVVFTEGTYAWGTKWRKRAVIADPWKLIRNFDDGSLELYHTRNDPAELVDRGGDPQLGPIQERLTALLDNFEQLALEVSSDQITVSDEERRLLEALGYTSDDE